MRLLLHEVGTLMPEDTEKVELLNTFFASVLTARGGCQESQTLAAKEKTWRNENFPLFEEDQVRVHLGKLVTYTSMEPSGTHPRVLGELANVIALHHL